MIRWIDGNVGSDADTAIGAYQIVHPHPRSRQYVVRFRRVAISRQVHNLITDAKAEAESHFLKGTTP